MRHLLFFIALGTSVFAFGDSCKVLAPVQQDSLITYIRARYKLAADTKLGIAKDDLVRDTCYRALTFDGSTAFNRWQVTMYLSPDQRFLMSELMDTTIDPVEQARKDAEAAMAELAQNRGSSKGSGQAPVTIVEFSDFECPYCRRFADLLDEVLPEERDSVRVVFHHMPLSIHPWARAAAEGAACAQLQTSDAFWGLHDQLFRHQAEITGANVKDRLLEYARQVKGLNLTNFQDCLDSQLSLGLVLKDMNLASAKNINSTPTLFINGSRIPGVKDSADLRRIIEEAKKESAVSLP